MSTQMGYGQDIEVKMKRLFATLSEKDRRRYAALEAAKLGSQARQRRHQRHLKPVWRGCQDGAPRIDGVGVTR